MKVKELQAIDPSRFLVICYEEIEPYLVRELERLQDNLIFLPEDASREKILSLFEDCVNRMNDLETDDELECCIDTEEREGLCAALYAMGSVVGLDPDTEYLDEWRDW